jgi:hypothetical protein
MSMSALRRIRLVFQKIAAMPQAGSALLESK